MAVISISTQIKIGDEYVPVERLWGPLFDHDELEGAIVFSIGEHAVSKLTYWDSIIDLWCYLLNGLEEFSQSGTMSLYWPDQPIRLQFRRLDASRTLVERSGSSDPDVREIADTSDLANTLLEAGAKFFDVMMRLEKTSKAFEDIALQIQRLRIWRNSRR